MAYIASSLCGMAKSSAMYDHSQSKTLNVSGSVAKKEIDVYDFDRSCHVSGNLDNLYDYGNGAHIQISCNGDKFSGYDYHNKFHFSGTVEAGFVSLFDYETQIYYRYS